MSTYLAEDPSQIEYQKQILLRFTLVGESYHHSAYAQDHLPPNLSVIVNNKIVILPQPKPTAKPNSDIIRPGSPADSRRATSRATLLSFHPQVGLLISPNTAVYRR